MKELFLPILLFLLSYPAFSQEAQVNVNIKDGTPLEDFISLVERDFGLLFSYRAEDVLDVKLKALSMQGEIANVLTKVLQPTPLQCKIINDNYVVLSRKPIGEEDHWLTFCGQVKDSLDNSPIAFASIFFTKSKKGTTTSSDGSFEIKGPLMANDSLVISYVGCQSQSFLAKSFSVNPCKIIHLSSVDFGEDFVVVTEYLTEGIELNNNDFSTQLRPNKSGILPGYVEADILESLQFLPGISSTDGTASGLSMRGGTADQNLILWEDIPIYHAAHYFGTISAFNPYIIDKVSVYRGGFDVGYGGRVSGVVDLKSEGLNTTKNKFGVGMNFLNVYTNGSISLADNKLKVVYSLRRSIAELWRSPTYESLTNRIQQGVLVQDVDLDNLPKGITINDDFRFFDSNVKLAYQASDKDELSIAGFYGYNDFEGEILDNRLKQRQADTLYLDNRGLSISWRHQWNDRLSTRLLAIHSDYAYTYDYRLQTESQNQMPGQPTEFENDKKGLKESRIEEQQIHIVNSYETKRAAELKLGYQLVDYETDFSLEKVRGSGVLDKEQRQKESKLHVLYGGFKTKNETRVGLDAGLRLSYFGLDKSTFFEPRIRLWYKQSDHLSFHFNGGRYYQFLSQLYEIAGDDSSISTPVWTLAGGNEAPVLDAFQFQGGMIFQKGSWLLDLQLYTKQINGQSSLSSEFDEELTRRYHIGNSKVRGVDVLLKKRWGGFRSWVSYTFSKNDYDFPTFFDPSFPGPTDQRHIFNWSNSYAWKQWEFSLGWRVSSGNPYSLLENFELKTNEDSPTGPKEFVRPVVPEFNSGNLPAMHQLDAAIRYTILPKKKGTWKGVIGLSVLNIYDQQNIYNRTFSIRKRPNEMANLEYTDKVALGFTPNMVFRVEW
ncbi:MAG: hypothetical protein ACJATF_001406 [Flavobacteriales bacterium]